MEIVYTWVKNIVCFYIFMNIIIHLLPRESYRKYVRFFSGMLLMILVATPVLSVLGKEDVLMQKINQAGFFQELDNIKLDTAHLEQTQKKVYLREYERAIAMDIGRIAEGKGLRPLRVEVRLSEDYQVESIDMEVSAAEEDAAVPNVSFGDGSGEYSGADELKRELTEFYRLEEERIEIAVQGE